MPKKVLIITYYWPPSGGAGVQRWLKFVKYLPELGWEPVVLTVDPNQASYAQMDESLKSEIRDDIQVYSTPTSELYSLYKRFSSKKEIPYGGFSNEGKVSMFQRISRFVRGNFLLPDPRKGWNRFAYKKAKEIIREHDIKTVITTSPPHSTQLIGLKLKKKLNVNWVADLRDPWTDIYYYKEFNHTALARHVDLCYEKNVLNHADRIITVSSELKQLFLSKMKNAEESKVTVIPNGYDEDDLPANEIERTSDKLIVTYTGTIAESYDISGYIEALKRLDASIRERLILRFVGNVPGSIVEKFKTAGFGKQLDLVGYVAHKESIQNLMGSDILLLVIPKIDYNKGIVPGKMFEYLAVKKSILCIGPTGGGADHIISECEAGETFEYDDVEGIYNFLNHYKVGATNGEKAKKYSRFQLTNRLVSELDQYEV